MKTYKGYSKNPYCSAHYPDTKFTSVADTPESLRLAKNTAQQSNSVYQKDFQTEKGKYTAVNEDPETLRLKKNTQQSSDIKYRGHTQTQAMQPQAAPSQAAPSQAAPQSYVAEPEPTRAPVQPPPTAAASPPPASASPVRYRALYDYSAADEDEVSFAEGDVIANGEIIDDGWMTGMVESTGKSGMLPANYVELI